MNTKYALERMLVLVSIMGWIFVFLEWMIPGFILPDIPLYVVLFVSTIGVWLVAVRHEHICAWEWTRTRLFLLSSSLLFISCMSARWLWTIGRWRFVLAIFIPCLILVVVRATTYPPDAYE